MHENIELRFINLFRFYMNTRFKCNKIRIEQLFQTFQSATTRSSVKEETNAKNKFYFLFP